MISKKELLSKIKKLEEKQESLEIELFKLQFPIGKINKESCYGVFGGRFFIGYSYSYIKKGIKIAEIPLGNSEIKSFSVFKDFENILLKADSDAPKYFILNKVDDTLSQIPEDLLSKDIIWERIY